MYRRFIFLLVAFIPSPAPAQAPADPTPSLRFKWQAGQVLTYKVQQRTSVRETTLDDKTGKPSTTEAGTALTLVKKWHVKEADAPGAATLELTIVELRNEIRRPDGTSLVVDSANPMDAKEMAGYLNVPILTVKVDGQGRVVEVKEAKGGSAARLNAELPFRMILPDGGPAAGQSWDRTFSVKLDPPHGTGETYDFAQKFTCTSVKDGLVAATVATELKSPPKAMAERVPLVPMLWTGEVYFNAAVGKLHAARLKVKAELPNHQGEGSKFEYESSYAEDAVERN